MISKAQNSRVCLVFVSALFDPPWIIPANPPDISHQAPAMTGGASRSSRTSCEVGNAPGLIVFQAPLLNNPSCALEQAHSIGTGIVCKL
jgi:hypothetical protein